MDDIRLNIRMSSASPKRARTNARPKLSLNDKVSAAAETVIHWHRILQEEIEQTGELDAVDFKFSDEERARKGECLVCEILAREDSEIVKRFATEFKNRTKQALDPVFLGLNDFESRLPNQGLMLKRTQSFRRLLNRQHANANALADELREATERKQWNKVATLWVEHNEFLSGIARLRGEMLQLEILWSKQAGRKVLRRHPTTPMANPKTGPVVRIESVLRVSFRSVFDTRLVSICRKITNTIGPFSDFSIEDSDWELVWKLHELLNQSGSLESEVYAGNEIHPNRLSEINDQFRSLVVCQRKFLQEIFTSPNDISAENAKAAAETKVKNNPHQSQPHKAWFSDDYTLAIISNSTESVANISISQELRDQLLRPIFDAGGRINRIQLKKNKNETFQPEKLLRSKAAKDLIKAGLLGKERSGRETVYWVKKSV